MANITKAFYTNYTADVNDGWLNRGGTYKDLVTQYSKEGELVELTNTIGEVGATKRASVRGATVPASDIDHNSRWVRPEIWDSNIHVAEAELKQMMVAPTGTYVKRQVNALAIAADNAIRTALTGTALTTRNGATNTVLPAKQKIAVGAGANGKLTMAKLTQIREVFSTNNKIDNEVIYLTVAPRQISDLLLTTNVGSADYNSVKALVNGEVDSFMGIKFIPDNSLAFASRTRECVAFVKSGIGFNSWGGVTVRMTELPSQSYITQLFASSMFGASRLDEDKVIAVPCLEE